jgi:hypothetical protein
MMQNISGQQINYDAFKKEFDNNPALDSLVDRFDDDGVVLKTKNKATKAPVRKSKGEAGDIKGSAKRAAANILKK